MGGRGSYGGKNPDANILAKEFQAASTLQKAEQYLTALTGKDAKFKNVPLAVANAVNEALKNVYDRFGENLDIREVQNVKAGWEKYMQGGYSNGVLSVKPGISSWEKNAEKQFSSRWIASKDKYGTLYHEFGHAYWQKLSSAQKSEITALYQRERKNVYHKWMAEGGSSNRKSQADYFGATLSKYAHTNQQEFFSEAFSQIMSGRMRPVSREVLQIIKKKK